MPMKCAICRKYHIPGNGIHFFRFPKKPHILEQWIRCCDVSEKNKFKYQNARVCSEHFEEKDFENWLQYETIKSKLRLKTDAVPIKPEKCVRLENELEDVPEWDEKNLDLKNDDESTMDADEFDRNVLEPQLLDTESNNSGSQTEANLLNEIENLKNREARFEIEDRLLRLRGESLRKENELLLNRVRCLESQNKFLVEKNELLVAEKRRVVEKAEREKFFQHAQLQRQFDEILSKYFTPTQAQVIKQMKSRVTWAEQDIVIAFTLRYVSKKCYLYLRNVLKYPLPCLSVLQNWASKVSLKYGLFNEVVQMISIASNKMSITDKLAVLLFDEMKVSEKYEHDKKRDAILGPHRYMQIIQVHSLFAKWKQPIFAKLDQQMTKELLLEVISTLYNIAGVTIVACVSNCGSTNQDLWSSLGISASNPWIQHPNADQKIYFFADAPHLLKLTRNFLLDDGFDWNGKYITKEPLSLLIKDRKSKFKCSKLHIECKGAIRERVRLAAELLSRSVSEALIEYAPPQETEIQKNCREVLSLFIQITNDWFDITNSYTEKGITPLKSAYGKSCYIQEQNAALDKMYNMIESIRCVGKNNLQVFQTAILMSINSLKQLFLDMKSKYKIHFISTHKVNLYALEYLFSQLRLNGGLNDHPSPSDILNKLKSLILGKSKIPVQNNTITKNDATDEEYIVGKLIKSLPGKKKNITNSADDTAVASTSKNSDEETCVSVNSENSSPQIEEINPAEPMHDYVDAEDIDSYHSTDASIASISKLSDNESCEIECMEELVLPIKKMKPTRDCGLIHNITVTNAIFNHSTDDYVFVNIDNSSPPIKQVKPTKDHYLVRDIGVTNADLNHSTERSDNSTNVIDSSQNSSQVFEKPNPTTTNDCKLISNVPVTKVNSNHSTNNDNNSPSQVFKKLKRTSDGKCISNIRVPKAN